MAYPGSLDTFTNPGPGDTLDNPPHHLLHSSVNNAVAAVQAKLGVDNSQDASSVDYLLKSTSSLNPGHRHTAASVTGLATVATTGSYTDLLNKPAPGGVTSAFGRAGAVTAQSGDYAIAQITGASPVAASGSYSDLTGKPTLGALAAKNQANLAGDVTGTLPAASVSGLAAVATSGSYNDLAAKPTLGTLAAKNQASLTADVTGSLPAASVAGLAAVATSGSYADLSNKPLPALGSAYQVLRVSAGGAALEYATVPSATLSGTTGAVQINGGGVFSSSASFNYSEPAAGTALLTMPAAFSIGGSSTLGSESVSIGFQSSASGTDSTAVGPYTTASGALSAAFGYNSTASASVSAAFGQRSNAYGQYACAFGSYAQANFASVAIGGQATGSSTVAIGFNTTASIQYSMSFGTGTGQSYFSGNVDFCTSFFSPVLSASQYTTATLRQIFGIAGEWVDNTDTTRKGRSKLGAYDYNGYREAIRCEANGSSALLGFYGASAALKPTVTGAKGGNAALASLVSALATLGLITDSTT